MTLKNLHIWRGNTRWTPCMPKELKSCKILLRLTKPVEKQMPKNWSIWMLLFLSKCGSTMMTPKCLMCRVPISHNFSLPLTVFENHSKSLIYNIAKKKATFMFKWKMFEFPRKNLKWDIFGNFSTLWLSTFFLISFSYYTKVWNDCFQVHIVYKYIVPIAYE